MRVVVSRVDAPCVSRVGVWRVPYAIGDRVSHARVGVLHVHFHPKRALALCESSRAHLFEIAQIVLDASIAPWRVNLLIAAAGHLLSTLEADVGLVAANQLDSMLVKLLEVVRGSCRLKRSVAEPIDNVLDMVDKFVVLFAGVRVVESQIGVAAISFCDLEVEADSFGVSNVQVAVWLGRETSVDLAPSEFAMLGEDFSRVANVNITTD